MPMVSIQDPIFSWLIFQTTTGYCATSAKPIFTAATIRAQWIALHSIPEAWIVDLDNRRLNNSRELAPGDYRSQQSLSELPTLAAVMLPGCSFDLTKLLGLTIAFII